MANSLFTSMGISASGMTAERARMDIVAENIANAQSTRTPGGGAYRRRMAVFQATPEKQSFGNIFSRQTQGATSVKISKITQDQSPLREVFDPSHPDADSRGILKLPNVDAVREMVDLTDASRSYESNVTVMETSKRLFMKSLDLLR